jgi:hypothetical protein
MAVLSCELPPTAGGGLPPVSEAVPMGTAPPRTVQASEARCEAQPSEGVDPRFRGLDERNPPGARLVAAVGAHLRARGRTGLVDSEIAEVARTIVEESCRHAIDPGLVLAVIYVESRYHAYSVSPVGAMGLMQILPTTGEELAAREGVVWRGPQTLFDPVVNVRLGVTYLRELTDRYESTPMALAAYNWGPGHIDRRLRRGAPMPTVYPALVFEAYTAQSERRS